MLAGLKKIQIVRNLNKPPHYYQKEAVEATEASWANGFNRSLICAPTGSGKGLITGELCAREIERGGRCLFLCHTKELVSKPRYEFENDFGCPATIEMASQKADDSPMVFASHQTMANRIKSGLWRSDSFSLVVGDECHRILSAQQTSVMNHWQGAKIVGCTATPRRGDRKDLMHFFDNIAYDIPLDRLIKEGFLSQLVIQEEPLDIKVQGKSKTGDITDEEAGEAVEPYLEKAADLTVKYGMGKCGLSFLPLRRLARKFADMLCERGMRAEYVAGEGGGAGGVSVQEQARIKRALEMGEIDHVSQAQLWGEGVDVRPLNFGVDLRPTRSWPQHVQKYGRFTRTYDPSAPYAPKGSRWGLKTEATILDFCFSSDHHNLLMRPSAIFAKDDNEADMINKQIKSGGGKPVNLLDAVAAVKSIQEETLRKRLAEMAVRKSRLVNPLELSASCHIPELAEYTPLARWEEEPVSESQRVTLEKCGVDLDSVGNQGLASLIIGVIRDRASKGLSTIKQSRYAAHLGHPSPWDASFAEVSEFINKHKPTYRK